ncbi:endolytic transglycosylase MltG [Candidatus Venteria ishoeyi]|uniref:Endolytic murein transglycosylase n=1 Tax=Candidatus Venteria ishoeyi TaxID=1899563 RepID=A0A1H6F6Y7_9GAMM|nr:endolytic transglycosylase MltG [Candidatus Venteria ishoeyi]MDM8547494.1 endolytic transglycosylase MltG [Candidatus Venteria ishoeyi]SEH05900.1 putative aminodeoxychorismate lyase [Candidatus Venteria ishoeyi]
MLKRFLVRLFLAILLSLLLISAGAYALYEYGLQRPLQLPQKTTYYTINPGMGVNQIAVALVREKIFNYPNALAWVLWARSQGKGHQIKAGEYKILPGSNARQLLALFISGKTVQHAFVIVEGWTFKQLLSALQQTQNLNHQLPKNSAAKVVMQQLDLAGIHPEGRFFPDTYYFTANTSDIALLQRAYQKMQKEQQATWEQRSPDVQVKDKTAALILASIIEKETASPQEYTQISGVFSRRLKKGMRLQTDPSVIYGMGDNFKGNIRKADLQRDTPYNTYTRAGLPPTPIALPGRAALLAAVQPAAGNSLYFVASGNGRHYFSSNLSEHECAVMRYQIKDKAPRKFARRCRKKPGCRVCKE